MRSSLIISRRAHIPSILRLLYSEKRPVLTPLSSLARRVLICCIHFTPYTLSADISHANLFSAIAFTSMHAVCFFFLHSKEIFFLQNVAFFVYNFHFHYNGLCVAVGSRARSYRTRNASHRIASHRRCIAEKRGVGLRLYFVVVPLHFFSGMRIWKFLLHALCVRVTKSSFGPIDGARAFTL